MSVDPVSVGIKAALMAAQMAMTASNKTEGPRLDTLDVSLADYGTPIGRFWGMRRLDGCPIIWAEKLTERKIESKTKGGKYSEYKYYGTFAVVIADHEIDGVSRIWLDKHLVYQAKDAGPVASVLGLMEGPLGIETKLTTGRNLRIHLGTEVQTADPRMEAWCEDRYGLNSCPAYRGVAYMVFQDLPLEKFGNRIPQVAVEAVSTKTDSFPYETKTTASQLVTAGFSPDYTRFYLHVGTALEVWDTASRTKMFAGSLPFAMTDGLGMSNDYLYGNRSGSPAGLWRIGLDGGATLLTSVFDAITAGYTYYVGGLICLGSNFSGALYYDGTKVAQVATGFTASFYFEDVNGQAWACGYGTNIIGLVAMPAGTASLVTTTTSGQAYAMDNGAGSFVAWQNGSLYLINKTTMAVTLTVAATSSNAMSAVFASVKPGAASIWIDNREFSTTTLAVLRTVTLSSWTTGNTQWTLYDPINHALIGGDSSAASLTWRYLDRLGNAGVTLATIVTDVAGWCGLSTISASTLTQVVKGYSVAPGSGKDMIEPLLDIHDCDARPHGFTVEFIKRGQATGGTILTEDFVRQGDDPRYVSAVAQATDLPRRITLNFADEGKDQQTNTVIAQRPLDAIDGVREASIDMTTYVATPTEAQQLTDRYFRRQWNGREEISNGLTMQHIGLEPGDVRTLSLDGLERTARLTKMTLTEGHLKCEWRRDALSLNGLGSSVGADMQGRDAEAIYIPGPTKGIALDIPLTADINDNAAPLIHYGAGSYSVGSWPGASIYKSDFDGDDFELWNGVESSGLAVWGIVNEAMPDANPWLWDRGSALTIKVFGTLTSCTEAQIDADPTLNQAAIGQEIVNFTTAVLEADGTYTVSGFKRGRRGTEWACATHVVGDTFVMVSSLLRDGLGLSEVGSAISFKAQTLLRDPAFAPAIPITFAGNSLKPYAPAKFTSSRDATSGDWTFTWVRRTRTGGAWNGSTIALGETSEAYELDVGARTITATSPTAVWTSAMQTTDLGSAQTTLPACAVYQMSASVGRGFATTL